MGGTTAIPGISRPANPLRARVILRDNLRAFRRILTARRNLNPLEVRLFNRINDILGKIRDGQNVTVREIEALETLLREYKQNRRPTGQELSAITTLEQDLVSMRESVRPAPQARVRPAPANNNSAQLNSHEANLRGRIVNGENSQLELSLDLHEIKINHTLSLGRVLELLSTRQNVTAEELVRAIPVEASRESSTAAADLLARVILNFVSDKLVKEVLRASERVGEVTRQSIEKIVKDINQELLRSVVEIKAKAEVEIRKDRDIDAQLAERRQDERSVNRETRVRLNIEGRLEQGELVKAARNLVNSRPAEIMPLLIRTAIRAMTTNLTQARVSADVAKTILSSVPQTALPVMLAERARAVKSNPQAAQALGQVISEVAQPFVQNLLTEAKAQQAVAGQAVELNLKTKDQAEQFIQVSKLVASANLAKMPAEKVTLKSARAFLEYVAKAQQVLRLIGPRQAKAAQAKASKPAPKPNYFSKGRTATAPKRNKVAPKDRTVRSRKALKELIRLQDEARLALPKELYDIIGTHYAGLAGLSGLKDSLITAPVQAQQQSQESSRNSHLRRVLQVMEARMNRVAPRVARSTAVQSIVASIKASSILFGIIISRVRAEEKKIAALLKALRSKGYMKDLVDAVDEGNTELVVDFITNLVVQAGSIANHGELTQEAVARAIENIEQQALAA